MVSSLISLKVKWYGHVLIKTLYEYTVALFLFCSLFAFGIFNPLFISKPIADILGNTLSPISEILYLLALNAVFVILFFCQRTIIFNHEFEHYAKTLPISKVADRVSSVVVLFVSNNFLWVLLLAGAFTALHDQPKVIVIFETVYLLLSLLMIQLFLYEKNINKLIGLILCNIVFVVAKYYLIEESIILCTIFFLSSFIIALACSDLKSTSFKIRSYSFTKLKLYTGSVLPIQLAILKPFRGFLCIKVLMSFSLQGIAALLITHIENPDLIYFIILFNYLTVCIMSSFSRVLALEIKKMLPYFRSLPIPTSYWFMKNQILNLIVTVFILFPGACFALSWSAFSVWMLLYIFFVGLAVNVVVYCSSAMKLRNTALLMYLVASILYVVQFLIR